MGLFVRQGLPLVQANLNSRTVPMGQGSVHRGQGSGVSELESGGSNWESTTLAPAYAARPKASVDIPSWRLAAAARR